MNEILVDALLFLASVLYLIIGYFLLFKGKSSSSSRLLAAISISSAFWTLGIVLFRIIPSYEFLYFLNKEFILASGFIASSFLHFALIFSKKIKEIKVLDMAIIHFPNIVILLGLNINHLFIENIVFQGWGRESILGWAYVYFGLYIIGYFLLGLYFLLKAYLPAKGNFRTQLGYILAATMITGSIDIYFNLILILLGNYKYIWVGPYSSFIWVLILAYAITKHRLMEISVIISRGLAWVFTVIFLGSIYSGLVLLYSTYITPQIGLLFLALTILYGILVGETFQRIRLFIQTTSDKVFLRGKYDYYKELSDMTTQITKTLSMDNILSTLRRAFFEVLEVSNPRIYLPDDFDKPEVKELLAVKELAFRGEDIIIPCLLEDRLIALIVLGKKLSEDPYTEEDVRILKSLAGQTAVAIDHTRTYEEIKKDFEANQQKLYDTERLLARSERIASMASLIQEYNHQIKTPLAIARGRVEMLFDKTRDPDYLKKMQQLIIEQIDRANDIVESTLRLSRPKEYREVELNLNDIINDSLQIFPPSGVHLVKELGSLPLIKGDREDLQLVFVNLIKNAVEAMTSTSPSASSGCRAESRHSVESPGGGNLKITTYSTVEGGQTLACVEVSDTGEGIPKEHLEKIFEPFFSTRVTKGRGLGLSIVFRIIREHGANIDVKSEVGKGTAFMLKFPLLTGEKKGEI